MFLYFVFYFFKKMKKKSSSVTSIGKPNVSPTLIVLTSFPDTSVSVRRLDLNVAMKRRRKKKKKHNNSLTPFFYTRNH